MKKNASNSAESKPRRGRKSWQEKLADDKDLPKVLTLEGAQAERYQGETMVIPAPREVDALMRQVQRGRLTTIDELRSALAGRHSTAVACPITTGIFAWIAAHAAAEAAGAGEKDPTPYWRTLKSKGELNPKYPGGVEALVAQLKSEGHEVIQKGKRYFVRDFQRSLEGLD